MTLTLELAPGQETEVRTRLRSFAEDWDRPDMDIYDSL